MINDIIRVYFWCLHAKNYNSARIGGVIFPFIMTTSLVAIFLQGLSLFFVEMDFLSALGPIFTYGICIALAVAITYFTCLKGDRYLEGEEYFRPLEEKKRRSTAIYFNAFFIFFCFSSRILFAIIGVMSVLV